MECVQEIVRTSDNVLAVQTNTHMHDARPHVQGNVCVLVAFSMIGLLHAVYSTGTSSATTILFTTLNFLLFFPRPGHDGHVQHEADHA